MAALRDFRSGSSPRTPVGQATQVGARICGLRTDSGRLVARAHTRWHSRR